MENMNESNYGYEQNQSPINFNFEEPRQVDSGKYHATLLLCYFFGPLGIHRLINKKIVSGIAMLLISIFAGIFMIVSFAVIGSGVEASDTNLEDMGYMLFFISFLISFITPFWSFIDLILIMSGNLKNGETKVPVISGKSFITTWSNILVLILLLLQSMSGIIWFIFILAAA